MLKFFVNYLQNREQCVTLAGKKSEYANVRSGVPQGSILGPLLFVLFINDMCEATDSATSIALYADDTKIWREINNWQDHEMLQSDINALLQWSIVNKMKFHPQKCKVVPIGYSYTHKEMVDYFEKNFPVQQIYMYRLGETELEYVKEEKDLGVIVTSNFSWDRHVETLVNKASSRLGLLKRTLHFVKSKEQKRSFYLAVVRSQFEHCVQIWRPTSVTFINKIERIQRRAVKWILCEQDHSYNEYEYLMRLRDLDLLPLSERFLLSDLTLFYDVYNELTCVKFPQHIRSCTDEERGRFKRKVKRPAHLEEAENLNFQSMREVRNDSFSLKCDIEAKKSVFKASFFFRTTQEWNSLPTEIKESSSRSVFRSRLREHLKQKVFNTELEN
jgi:hypothetical protein